MADIKSRTTLDTRVVTLAEMSGFPLVGDDVYATHPIDVRSLTVTATRRDALPWEVAHIEVRGEPVGDDGKPIEMYVSRIYHGETGYVYVLGNAPGWVRGLARHAVNGDPLTTARFARALGPDFVGLRVRHVANGSQGKALAQDGDQVTVFLDGGGLQEFPAGELARLDGEAVTS